MVPMGEVAQNKPDLTSLRIDDHKRGSGSAGKRIALFVFGIILLLVIAGEVYAFIPRATAVEVATAQQAIDFLKSLPPG